MNYEDFLKKEEEETKSPAEEATELEEASDLDVQKAVVESLAADKAERELEIEELRKDNAEKAALIEKYKAAEAGFAAETQKLKAEIEKLKEEVAKTGEILSKNSESAASNQISLLDRSTEIDDKFEGETRDHVLEVLREARDASEKAGRLRRAQLLESVLVANEPCGELAKRREELEKIFADNQNIINGQVINELDKLGITYKVGENYLLAKEIVQRAY